MIDRQQRWAILVSVALHLAAAGLLVSASRQTLREGAPAPKTSILTMVVTPPNSPSPPAPARAQPTPQPKPPPKVRAPLPAAAPPEVAADTEPPTGRAYMDAPPAPSAEEWALAATYTLKNSKRYRHNWGQQVRSQMGTAHEGPEQGIVRFRIEIAPSGSLARLDTLWTTSAEIEQRARTAIGQMPPLPPTPNGKPLIFEKTIVFNAWTAESPPLYKNDCLPDPPPRGNRFVWDGRSPQGPPADEPEPEKPDPQALADCLKQLPQDSIEAEAADDQRQQAQWGSQKLGR